MFANLFAFGMGSTWILGDCLGGEDFFKLKLICGDLFFGIFPPGKKTFNYSGPPKQWVGTRIRKKTCHYSAPVD